MFQLLSKFLLEVVIKSGVGMIMNLHRHFQENIKTCPTLENLSLSENI